MRTPLSSIDSDGFYLCEDCLPPQDYFDELYEMFDEFVAHVEESRALRDLLATASALWSNDMRRVAYYTNVPMEFRDRISRSEKADKVYLHYFQEFGALISQNLAELASHFPTLTRLLWRMEEIWFKAGQIMYATVSDADCQYPGVRRLLVHNDRPYPIVLRLIRYEPGERLGTTPHVDKSAFTAILNSSDPREENFVLSRWNGLPVRLSTLAPVERKKADSTSALIIPGMYLREMGFSEIQPSPHAVLPVVSARRRHAVVAFWLVPNMAAAHLDANVPFESAA